MTLPTDFRGSRQAAEALLEAIDPARYGAPRNHLNGAVTRLSPYIRHGVLTLAEVRDRVLARGGGGKLIQELGWRDYWQRLWRQWGDGIWVDREPLKTGHPPEAYGPDLPADLSAAATGLACIDAFATDLMVTGWLHNHARMWLAAYVVHWRRVRWQAGARWFLQHLLDADPASNNLSWQWLASSFSHKPYIFNRANLERFGGGRYCAACPAASRGGAAAPGGCPFDASYEWLQARLFRSPEPGEQALPPGGLAAGGGVMEEGPDRSVAPLALALAAPLQPPRRPLVWVHEEALGPANPALRAHPGSPALAVLDPAGIAGLALSPSPHRLRFLRDCLRELPLELREGDGGAVLLAAAAAHGADAIVTSRPVDPRLLRLASRLAAALPLQLLEPEPFVALPFEGPGAPDLGRFSRYWRRAEPLLWRN